MSMLRGPLRRAATLRRAAVVSVWLAAACPGPATPSAAAAPEADSSGGAVSAFIPVPFDSATTERYRATAVRLARAIATGEAEAFRALHTDAGWEQTDDWWKAMLVNQKKRFGPVVRVVGPLRGVIRMGATGVGLPRDGAAILLRFKGAAGASMSFVLDAEGRIERSSLWVAEELAQAETGDAAVLWPVAKHAGGR